MTTKKSMGFSLIEMMITLSLGLLILGMVINLFITTKQNHTQNSRVSSVLENGRFALRMLSNDLKAVGFMGGMWEMTSLSIDPSISLAVDCGQAAEANWAYDVQTYSHMQFRYNVSSVTANSQFQCINAGDFQNSTDVLAVKRTYTEKDTAALANNVVYLRSDYNTGCFWYHDAANPNPAGVNCPAANFEDWRYLVNIYYIRSYTDNPGDGNPSLCKKYLTASNDPTPVPTMAEVCLAEGIEHFHVQYGIDTDLPRDGVANTFISNPTATQVSTQAVSAKIFVLVRADREDTTFTNNKTYTMGDRQIVVNDMYYRRMYSTTVVLRNPRNTALFNAF